MVPEVDSQCFFFSRGPHTKQKKIVWKPPYNRAGMHSRTIQCKQAAQTLIVGKGRHVYVRVGGKHRKCMASLYKHTGKLQRVVTLILRHESKLSVIKSRISTHSVCPCKNYLPKCSQTFIAEIFFFST